MNFSVILLHEPMWDKQGATVTTSLTPLDVHDIARSCRTFDVRHFFIAHPSASLRSLARTLLRHWDEGFGSTYNPNRREALSRVDLVEDLDEAIAKIELSCGSLPTLVATSAHEGAERTQFATLSTQLHQSEEPFLLMLGTGWGMAPALLARADLFLEPIRGPGPYNHLSVRSACAIMLDRLISTRSS